MYFENGLFAVGIERSGVETVFDSSVDVEQVAIFGHEVIACGCELVDILDYLGVVAYRLLGIYFCQKSAGYVLAETCLVAVAVGGVQKCVVKVLEDVFVCLSLGVLCGEVALVRFTNIVGGYILRHGSDDGNIAPHAHHAEPDECPEYLCLGTHDVDFCLAEAVVCHGCDTYNEFGASGGLKHVVVPVAVYAECGAVEVVCSGIYHLGA